MNRKVLVIAVALMAVAMLATPVLAKPAQKIDFTAQLTNIGSTVVDTFTTPSGIEHRDVLGWGIITSWTGAEESTFLGAATSSVISVTNNLNTGTGVIKFDMTWHLTGGTFEGNVIGHLDGVGPTAAQTDLHGVFQGTGDFKGQTIILNGNKPSGQPFTWTGTIIIP
jgi:hypothetical protein